MDALAFSGPAGARNLASALRKLSGLLEAGLVTLHSVDTSSAIHSEEHSVQHIALTYILSNSPPGIPPEAPKTHLHS